MLYFWLFVLLVVIAGAIWLVFVMSRSRSRVGTGGGNKSDDIRSRVNLYIAVPRIKKDKTQESKDSRKEYIAPMETVFSNLTGIAEAVGDRHLTFEIATAGELITFYATVPKELQGFVEKQITSQYPDAIIEVAPYPNIFPKEGRAVAAQLGLKKDEAYPIRIYEKLESDGLNALTNALSELAEQNAGAAIQIALKPTRKSWQDRAHKLARDMQQGKEALGDLGKEVARGLIDVVRVSGDKETTKSEDSPKKLTALQEEVVSAIEQKANNTGFDVVIRLVSAGPDETQARLHLRTLIDSFLQFGAPELNQFVLESVPETEVIKNYVLRQFGSSKSSFVLNAEELATIFHLPTPYTETPNIKWLSAKRLPAPDNLPKEGILIGKNTYRGIEKMIRIERDDRRRHMYAIGKTGTGKSYWMQNMALQDIVNGEGVCVIDPHGEMIDWLLQRIPKDRIDDVIHFYPPDIERPMGLNLLEAKTPADKDMVVGEMISIFYKLFDPQGSGIVGPIFEHYMRNAMLLLLADSQEGATLIDIPRVFTDKAYRTKKLAFVTDPTVLRFWQEEFERAEKSNQVGELFSYIISKIGRFISNEMMRNIIGQTKSAFDFRDIMDNKKILLVNLSKGLTGDLNSNMLGFIIVSKLQMAALSRADSPGKEYADFYLYIDEFQNVTTDSIATILSEARKYRLNLIVAHQFMAQLEDNIRDAVLGNVGSTVAFRVGAPDADTIAKQFEPDVSENDLINIENRNAYVKLMINGTSTRPFTMQTLPAMGQNNEKIGQAIRQLSRLKFGQNKKVIEYDVGERIKYARNIQKDLPNNDKSV
ncbi:MAG: DUF87 domain-containing protein [Patescibacteria group bacterium]|nr:DUF87 domain-containing protein [Patescibacteria group bacterium]